MASGCKAHSCYEAGRDGWWLHRWLHEQGVDNIVVDAASIEVNRRARRAKTDRLDGDKLLAMLLRHLNGERVWSVLREPSREAEDERRTHRDLGRLTQERIAHQTRIQALLVLHNLRPQIVIGGRDWAKWWEELPKDTQAFRDVLFETLLRVPFETFWLPRERAARKKQWALRDEHLQRVKSALADEQAFV